MRNSGWWDSGVAGGQDSEKGGYLCMSSRGFLFDTGNFHLQEMNAARRHALQKQAAFNLGVAEAVSDKKNARPEKEPPRAYIFQRRPLTPPRYLKQQQLDGFLASQVSILYR